MKKYSLIVLGVLPAITGLAAELLISAFNGNGELTWTNSVSSNATYRVEWAGSATGPWNKFDALTNLTLLSATSNVVTVKVPTFYRLVWVDAPPHAGIWNYSGFDTNGSLVVTGWMSLSAQTNPIKGIFRFDRAGSGSTAGHLIGSGAFEGFATNNFVGLEETPRVIDGQFRLGGEIDVNLYTGRWVLGPTFAGGFFEGTFSAERRIIDP